MSKKALGSSLRRGVLTGTVAGFVAGWSAFVGHGKQLDALQIDAWQEVEQKRADVVLPPVPGIPDLPPVPGAQTYRLRYGPVEPLPRVTATAASGSRATTVPAATAAPANPGTVAPRVATPAPLPTFAPLPTLPPAPVVPAPTTKTSPPRK